MRIANQIQVKDKWSGRPLRAGEAFAIRVMNIIQDFYKEKGIWSEDDSQSQIWIGQASAFAEYDPGQKPAIVLKRGQVSYENVSGKDKMLYQRRQTGSSTYTDQVSSIVTVNCIHTNMTQSEDIGLEIFELFGYIRPNLRYEGFQNFKGPTIMEVAQLQGSIRPGSWATSLQMSGSMQVTWEVTPDAAELKAINTRRTTR